MAPTKVPKKPLKAMEKPAQKPPTMKTKKSKKKDYTNFSIYLYKILRAVSESQGKLGITRKSMLIMNNFVYDMLEKVAVEAGKLAAHSKKSTMTSREVQTAVKLLIPGELAKHANLEALKAVTLYHNSQDK